MAAFAAIDVDIESVTAGNAAGRVNDHGVARRSSLRIKRLLNTQRTFMTMHKPGGRKRCNARVLQPARIPLEPEVKPSHPGRMRRAGLRFGNVLLKRHVFVWLHR